MPGLIMVSLPVIRLKPLSYGTAVKPKKCSSIIRHIVLLYLLLFFRPTA